MCGPGGLLQYWSGKRAAGWQNRFPVELTLTVTGKKSGAKDLPHQKAQKWAFQPSQLFSSLKSLNLLGDITERVAAPFTATVAVMVS